MLTSIKVHRSRHLLFVYLKTSVASQWLDIGPMLYCDVTPKSQNCVARSVTEVSIGAQQLVKTHYRGNKHTQQLAHVAGVSERKIWSWVPWGLTPRMTVLAKTSSNLPDPTD
jgi:hypothetical protein